MKLTLNNSDGLGPWLVPMPHPLPYNTIYFCSNCAASCCACSGWWLFLIISFGISFYVIFKSGCIKESNLMNIYYGVSSFIILLNRQ